MIATTYTNGHAAAPTEYGQIMAELLRERSRRMQAEAELGILRSRLAGKERSSRIVKMAQRDASELLLRKTTGYAISRDAMHAEGMSERRWTWAIAMLKYANIIMQKSKHFGFKWFTHETTDLFEMLAEACERLNNADKPLEKLRSCLPNARRK